VGGIDGVLAVDPDEPLGLEEWCDLADRPDIDERCARAQADFSFPTHGPEVVNVVRVEHAMLTAGDMNEDSMRCHTSVVARLGRYAHGLVASRMGWCFGE